MSTTKPAILRLEVTSLPPAESGVCVLAAGASVAPVEDENDDEEEDEPEAGRQKSLAHLPLFFF